MQKRKGISLIVLVITIIVMIILAASVVITLSNSSMINRTNEAVNLSNIKQIEQIAQIAWGEAYADGARTKAELQYAVDEALKDIDTSMLDVEVTEKGVIVSASGEKILPISWNSMDVMGNASFTLETMPFVKVSDKLPTLKEIENSIVRVTMGGQTMVAPFGEVQELGENLILVYNGAVFCIANVAGEIAEAGITILETGFYSLDYGSIGEDADFEICICKHTNTVIENAKNATCVKSGYTGDVICECGKILTKGNDIPATQNHTWSEYNVCTVCKTVRYSAGEVTLIAKITWDGFSPNSGENIWSDGKNTYYSEGSKQYVLNNGIWERKTWIGLNNFYGSGIWSDGENIYYTGVAQTASNCKQYVLNGNTWEVKTWNGLTNFAGSHVWSDGIDVYYSYRAAPGTDGDYILNKATDTWEVKTWNNSNINGEKIWTDGVNVYCSSSYVFDKATDTWKAKTWNGLSNFYGEYIWSDGINTYYSLNSAQYVLKGDTWEKKIWNGETAALGNLPGNYIWTDGTNYYYSNGSLQYIFSR